MKTTKLLTTLAITTLLGFQSYAQCDLITANGSTQMPNGVCVPVTFGMEAHYEFLVPVDTSLVEILSVGTMLLIPKHLFPEIGTPQVILYGQQQHIFTLQTSNARKQQKLLLFMMA